MDKSKAIAELEMKPQEIGMTLIGIENMEIFPEILEILKFLKHKILISRTEFKLHELAMSLNGLFRLNSDDPEVISIISLLSNIVKSCEERFSNGMVDNLLSNLNNFKADSVEIQRLKIILESKRTSFYFNTKNLSFLD
jgi:hypothetical protein